MLYKINCFLTLYLQLQQVEFNYIYTKKNSSNSTQLKIVFSYIRKLFSTTSDSPITEIKGKKTSEIKRNRRI